MKTLLRVTGLAFAVGLFGAQAHADGSKCVSMDNDIARLACFDDAYRRSDAPDLDPREAVQLLSDLVQIDSPTESLTLSGGEDPCSVKAVYEGIIVYNTLPKPYQIISYANLDSVERIGAWRGYSDWMGGVRGMVLYTKRNHDGIWVASVDREYLKGSATIQGVDFYAIPETKTYNGRDAVFYLLPQQYRTDAAKVQDAIEDAILACGGAVR